MANNQIPTKARQVVRERDKGKCVRCRGPATAWHHRRSRSVRDLHQHCPCNGISLCRACHDWVHANPFHARSKGWIVSRHADPSEMQLEHVQLGWIKLTCEGLWSMTHSYEEEEKYDE